MNDVLRDVLGKFVLVYLDDIVIFTALIPMEIGSSHRCAVTQHQRTAALFRASCSPHSSVLLCKTASPQVV